MNNRLKLRPFVIPMIYAISGFVLVLSVFFLYKTLENGDDKDDQVYVDENVIEEDIPVVADNIIIQRPYVEEGIKVAKTFYDYKDEEETQKNSLILYENTYIQNSGVDYNGKENFNVLSILDGTVAKVLDDNVLGKVVEIKHKNDLISSYQCLSETSLKENDSVSQGEIIGKSGTCNISKELGDHLHFELFLKGSVVNPELYFDKNLKDL